MARPNVVVPKPKPITRPRFIPAPSGDLKPALAQTYVSKSGQPLQEQLRAIADWQAQNGMTPVPVSDRFGIPRDGLDAPMVPSVVRESTLQKELESRFYGPEHTQELLDIADAQGPPVLTLGAAPLPKTKTPYTDNANRPMFMIERTEGKPKNVYSHLFAKGAPDDEEPIVRAVVTQRGGKPERGLSEEEAISHELGHGQTLTRGYPEDGITFRQAVRALVKSNPQFEKHPELLFQVADHLTYKTRMDELTATANQLRRAEYALTGELPRTEAQRMAMLDKWITSKPARLGRSPDPMNLNPWPDDEVYQYGPRAGQPAREVKSMREYIREALMSMDPEGEEMGDFIEMFNRGASTAKPNPSVAYG